VFTRSARQLPNVKLCSLSTATSVTEFALWYVSWDLRVSECHALEAVTTAQSSGRSTGSEEVAVPIASCTGAVALFARVSRSSASHVHGGVMRFVRRCWTRTIQNIRRKFWKYMLRSPLTQTKHLGCKIQVK
jgi:hypothetical protein